MRRTAPPVFAVPVSEQWESAIRILCSQDFSIVKPPGDAALVESHIELPIDFDTVMPLELAPSSFQCPCLEQLVGDQAPLSFLIPCLQLKVLSERRLNTV